jgi:hypothetical protein
VLPAEKPPEVSAAPREIFVTSQDSRPPITAAAHRQARACRLTQIVLTAAMQQHRLIEGQMAAFLASAAQLAQRGWRTGDPDDGP